MKIKKILLASLLICLSTLAYAQKGKNKKGDKEESKTEVKSSKENTKEEEAYQKPQMKVQLGHTGYISEYAVSPDGKFLATTSPHDNICKLWDILTARELLSFKKDTNRIIDLHFSLDGKYLLQTIGQHDKFLRVLEVQTGKEIHRFGVSAGFYDKVQLIAGTTHAAYINQNPNDKNKIFISNGKTFSLDEEIIIFKLSNNGLYITALGRTELAVWETATGKVLQKIKSTKSNHKSYSTKSKQREYLPQFTSDSKYLYFFQDDDVKKLNLSTNVIENIPAGIQVKESMSISRDGKYLIASNAVDPNIYLYTLADGKLVKQLPKAVDIRDFSAISDDASFILQNQDYWVSRVYDLKSLKNDFITLPSNEVAMIPGTNYLIAKKDSAYSSSNLYLMDALSGRVLREFKSFVKGVSFSRFSPDGKYAVWIQDSTRLVFWNMFEGAKFRSFHAHTDDITSLAFSNNGKWIATGGADKSVKIWELETGKLVRSMSVYTKWISSVTFSPDDKFIAAQSEELTFKIWETETGKEFKKYKGHTERVSCVAFSPDGKYIVSGSWDKTLRVWNIQASTTIRTITGLEHPVNSIAFNKDGSLIAAGGGGNFFGTYNYVGDNKIKIWEFASSKPITTISGPANGSVIQLKFSDDNKYLLSRTDVLDYTFGWEIIELNSVYTQAMDLWRISDGKSIRNFQGNFNDASKLFVTPNLFLHTDDKNNIHLSDLTTGLDKKVFSGHTGFINNLTLSQDGKYLISRSNDDGFMKMWSMDTQKEVLNYIILGGKNNDYLIYSPENYYMSSKGGTKAVHYVVNFKVYEFEQFDLQYNRPDKVLGSLNGISPELIESYSKAYKKRLKKLDFSEEMFSKELHHPVVKLSSKNIPLSTKNKTIALSYSVSDSKYMLDRIYVTVNDVPVYGMKGIELKTKKIKQIEQPINLTLSNGRNKIKVSCVNDKGVESLAEHLEIICDAPITKPTLYLLTIGVSNYKDSKMNLQFAAKDATDLASLFQKNTSSQYSSVQLLSVVNEKATKENILTLKAKLMMGKPDDVVMLMVSSHGLLDSELDYYIATTDVDFANPAARGLSYEALESILDGIPQRKKILFMDACHSGEVDKEEIQIAKNTTPENTGNIVFRSVPGVSVSKIGLENSFELMKEMFADLRHGSGATVISSAGGAEYAIEGTEWNNGVFTYCLINGLRDKKADLNNDGIIKLSEIEEYLQKKVPELTNGKQKPTSRAENTSNDFVVW
jgi:WD40 repeat protein